MAPVRYRPPDWARWATAMADEAAALLAVPTLVPDDARQTAPTPPAHFAADAPSAASSTRPTSPPLRPRPRAPVRTRRDASASPPASVRDSPAAFGSRAAPARPLAPSPGPVRPSVRLKRRHGAVVAGRSTAHALHEGAASSSDVLPARHAGHGDNYLPSFAAAVPASSAAAGAAFATGPPSTGRRRRRSARASRSPPSPSSAVRALALIPL